MAKRGERIVDFFILGDKKNPDSDGNYLYQDFQMFGRKLNKYEYFSPTWSCGSR